MDDDKTVVSATWPDSSSSGAAGKARRLLTGLALPSVVSTCRSLLDRGVIGSVAGAIHNVGSHIDFRSPYFGALDLATGANPYRRGPEERPSDRTARDLGIEHMSTLYAPPFLALHLPLLPLGFVGARLVFLGINVTCLVLALRALVRLAPFRDHVILLGAVLMVTAFGQTPRSLVLGQINAVVLLLLCEGARRLSQGRDMAAGVFIGVATLIKPRPALPFVPIALRWRWRAFVGGGTPVLLPVVISVALFGIGLHQDFLSQSGALACGEHAQLNNQSMEGVLVRSLARNPTVPPYANRPDLVRPLWLGCAVGIMAIAVAAAWFGKGSPSQGPCGYSCLQAS